MKNSTAVPIGVSKNPPSVDVTKVGGGYILSQYAADGECKKAIAGSEADRNKMLDQFLRTGKDKDGTKRGR